MKKENIIEVRNITKDYGKGRGIFDFSFNVKKGEVFGLVGTNGSGKTTTMRHLMGFIKGNSGTVDIDGMDAWKDAADVKRKVGYIPGQIDFPDVGSGTAFLKIQTELMGLKDLSYMNSLIDRFKIDITAPLRRMSKGMKQKMAIVACFMTQPDIYLLDEPSTGLDPLMRDTLIEVILEQKKKGKTIFMSSHIFKELEDTCDSIMFIKNGHIINTVRRSQFDADPHESYTIVFHSKKDYERYLQYDHHMTDGKSLGDALILQEDDRQRVTVNIPVVRLNDFFKDLSEYSISSLSNEAYTLEKYYVNIIENQEVR